MKVVKVKLKNAPRPKEIKPVDGSRLKELAGPSKGQVEPKRRGRAQPKPLSEPKPDAPTETRVETDGSALKKAMRRSNSPEKIKVLPKDGPLVLGTLWFSEDREGGRCSECGERVKVLHIYRESNRETVKLCEHCEAEALDRSYGTDDAMEHTPVRGGPADANRPKIRPVKDK